MNGPRLQRLVLKQIVGPIAAMILLGGLALMLQGRSTVEDQLRSNTESIVQAISPDIMAVHLLGDQLKASEIGSRLKAFPALLQLAAYDTNNQRIYLYEVPKYETLNASPVDAPLLETFEYGEYHVRFKVPIYTNGRESGFAVVVHSITPFQAQQRSNILFGIGIILAATVLAGSLHLWLKRHIIDPISSLAQLHQHVAETNDYSVQSPIDSSLELSRLQHGFNTMLKAADAANEEVRQNATKLQGSKNQLEGLLQNMQDGFLLVHQSGQIRHANRAFLEIFDLTTLPFDIQDLNVWLKDYSEPDIIRLCLNHQQDSFTIRKEKTNVLLECMAVAISDSKEAIVIVRDISSEESAQHAQHALQQAQKMEAVGKLAGNVAHDFNNLLTIIVALSHDLSQELENELHREDAEEIFKAAELAADLTQKLLAFSRKQVSSVQLVDLNAVLLHFKPMLQRLVSDSVELVINPSNLPCWLEGSTNHLEQILINLVNNASEAMPSGGRLTVSSSTENIRTEDPRRGAVPPGLMAVLKVTDTGTGINDDTRPRIFEPFFTTKGDGHAMGLGLATTQKMVHKLHGHIHVETQLGTGSTFSILFPLMNDPQGTDASTPQQTVSESGMSATIMVVEDTEPVLKVVTNALERVGHRTLVARNPSEALEMVERDRPQIDLLLTDVEMPQLSGPELFEEIGKRLKIQIPVLYMSGHVDQTAGADKIAPEQLIFKPFRAEDIVAKVASIMASAPAKPLG